MLKIHCPHCNEVREEEEFTYRGEAFIARPADAALNTLDDAGFGDYLFMRVNHKGLMYENWYHGGGCRHFLVVARDNVTNEISGSWSMTGAPKGVTYE
ncbi:sarcosine oxidase subunit delta [Pseudomonas sp. G2-4]|uniref:sarcosine oxidase subunit delta n=1 Tax=Pseudomonas sp. G2-4 TaxID=1506334 RepID=UPI0024B878D8|nr:sarcosine oxidase subunit delta [Pseudomonas sp. G2-4]WHS62433.1 sarcosine oxidase subunit delta [Pseudomonas sp. G2-4]